jgi:hypothetical protein
LEAQLATAPFVLWPRPDLALWTLWPDAALWALRTTSTVRAITTGGGPLTLRAGRTGCALRP